MKLLIVEDELLVRAGIRLIIDWAAYDIELLEDAQDGAEALKRIREEHPDIILLDLQLPQCSGLEILKTIKQETLPCKVIVVSCYDDLHNVREAMKFGAIDYLHKFNIRPAELLETVLRVKRALDEQSGLSSYAALSSQSETASSLSAVLSDSSVSVNAALASGFPIVVCVDHPQENNHSIEQLANLFAEMLNTFSLTYSTFLQSNDTLFIAVTNEQLPENLLERMQEKARKKLNMSISIGSGPKWSEPMRLRENFRIAEQVKQIRFYAGIGQICRIEQLFILRSVLNNNSAFEKQLHHVLELGMYASVFDCFHTFLDEIRRHSDYDRVAICVCCIDAINLVSRKVMPYQQYAASKSLLLPQFISCPTLDSLLEKIDQYLQQLFQCYKPNENVRISPIVKSAVTYIRQHLHEKITLSQLASSIAVSESYLSTLFHKEMQESCITYINRSKIELAKTLLASGALVYEVSGQLGFDNSNYFGKVFKKYTGSTPEAYRALHNSGTEG